MGYLVFYAARNPIATLFGLPSFGIAIYLATRKHSTDKINGWIRIGIGLVIGIIAYMKAAQRL